MSKFEIIFRIICCLTFMSLFYTSCVLVIAKIKAGISIPENIAVTILFAIVFLTMAFASIFSKF